MKYEAPWETFKYKANHVLSGDEALLKLRGSEYLCDNPNCQKHLLTEFDTNINRRRFSSMFRTQILLDEIVQFNKSKYCADCDKDAQKINLKLEEITSKNLGGAIAAAREIFPYEIHADGFWPEVAFKMAIKEQNPHFKYYLACIDGAIVGITGHYPSEDGSEIWIGWFGVIPSQRGKGYGELILRATEEEVVKMGVHELYLYTGDRDEERFAHKLYMRLGFKETGRGKIDGDPCLYFKASLPLK